MLIVENLNALHDELNSHRDVNCTEGLRLVQLRIHAQQQSSLQLSIQEGVVRIRCQAGLHVIYRKRITFAYAAPVLCPCSSRPQVN